ncbi:porin [uncultured Caballeronia sp.]|uniref:porin n=1 Tax=uncultured Caballeronia sp. TaxID=1827198 RepID=UPI0035C9A552
MKKTVPVAALLGICISSAHAQSNVTLYGVVTADITYANDVQTAATPSHGDSVGGRQVAQLDSGSTGLSSSRWGLQGKEDLGDGWKAIFQLENGFNVNNGSSLQGGAEFGRLAIVGLSNPYGTVTIGRQGNSAIDFTAPLAYAWLWGNIAIHPADYDNLNIRRTINAVKYVSPSFAGFNFGGMYSLGGVAGSVGENQVWSAGLGYSGGPITVGASILNSRDPNSSLYGTNVNALATANNLGSFGSATSASFNGVIAGFASAGTTQIVTAAALYAIGPARVGVTYSNTQFRNLGEEGVLNTLHYSGTATFNNYEVSLRYQLTPSSRLGAAYDLSRGGRVNDNSGSKYQQFNLGVDYFLSKSTDVYVLGAYQHANGTDSLGRPAVAEIGYLSPSPTNKQLVVSAGIKHLF